MAEKLKVSVRESQIPEFGAEHITLMRPDESRALNADVYVDRGFFSIYWPTNLPPEQLTDLAEKCVVHYESQHQLRTTTSELKESEGHEQDEKYQQGVLLFTNNNGEGERDELPYQRPLSWQQITQAARKRNISYVRINTPVGDFAIQPDSTAYNFGVMSHVLSPEGFKELVENSTGDEVGSQEAQSLLEAVVAKFQTN